MTESLDESQFERNGFLLEDISRLFDYQCRYLYQAERLTKDLIETAVRYWETLGNRYISQDQPRVEAAMRCWEKAGGWSLRFAQQATDRKEVVDAMGNACKFGVDKIMKVVLGLPTPSLGQIKIATNWYLILRRWHAELDIFGPKVDELDEIYSRLNVLEEGMKAGSAIAPYY